MSGFESVLASYVLNSLWQAPLVFGAAWIAARLLRASGAEMEHRVWVVALMLEGLLPAVSMWQQVHIAWPWHANSSAIGDGQVSVQMGAGTGFAALTLPPAVTTALAVPYGLLTVYFIARFLWRCTRLSALVQGSERLVLSSEVALACDRCSDRFGIMRSVEDSYQRLGLAKIDILFVHDIGEYQHGKEANEAHMKSLRESGYRALDELRRTGVVSAIGLGVNEKEVLIEVLKFGDWDAFLLAGRYTLLEQAPLDDLLPMCAARGTSIVVGGPLNSGILAGRETWNYAAAPSDIVRKVNSIRQVCDAHGVPLPAAALQFPLAHPAVAAIIPGPRAPAEFEENARLMRHKIPAALWADLRNQQLLHPEAPTPS